MPLTYLLLALAIVAEVFGTISLRFSNGFSRLLPSILVVVGYMAAFVLLGVVLKRGLPVSIAYAIWAGVGVALVAAVGTLFLDERLSLVQVAGVVLIVFGVIAVEMGSASSAGG